MTPPECSRVLSACHAPPRLRGHKRESNMQSSSRGRVLALFVVPLSQPGAGTAPILVDELDARGFQSAAYGKAPLPSNRPTRTPGLRSRGTSTSNYPGTARSLLSYSIRPTLGFLKGQDAGLKAFVFIDARPRSTRPPWHEECLVRPDEFSAESVHLP
jgi:hypothetical protein